MVSPTAVALRHVWLHGRILVPQWFCPCGQCHHQKGFKNNDIAAPVKVARQQTTPKLCSTFRNTWTLRNPPEPSGSCLRNLPEVASGTYTSTHRNPPEPSEPPSGTYTSTHRNSPEPASGTYTSTRRNSPEPSGTFVRNLLLRPAPAHTGAYLGWRPR